MSRRLHVLGLVAAPLFALLTGASPAWAGKPKGAAGPRAPELSPAEEIDEIALWRDMAAWYIDNHLPEEALAMVARVRERGESNAELDLIQGRALLAQGIPEEAQHVLLQVLPKLPGDPRPLRALGLVHADLGEPEAALDYLLKAVDLAPDDAPTLNNVGFLELGLGRCEEAVGHLERVVALDGTNGRYRNNLAFALVCVGEPQRALSLFRSTGSEADARYNMGVAYERIDKVPPALAQYQAAVEADPAHAKARDALQRLTTPTEEVSP